MTRIIIDGIECDFKEAKGFKMSYNGEAMTNLELGRGAKRIEVTMPFSQHNSAVFGTAGEMHSPAKFNHAWHPMSIEQDGLTLFEGTAYLMESYFEDDNQLFKVECRGELEEWVLRALQTPISDISLDGYSTYLNQESIEESWSDSSPVKFLPIERDIYKLEPTGSDSSGMQKVRSIDDFHPFINIKALIEGFFDKYGYTVESSFFESEMFRNLYLSGNYKSSENTSERNAMGFMLKHGEDSTTECNYAGVVSFDAYTPANSFGNIIDTTSTTYDKECYNNGNCAKIDRKEVIFAPLKSVSVGFEYRLHYICECEILSRSELRGLNSLYNANGYQIDWHLRNAHLDQRDSIYADLEYTLMIFDVASDETYRLVGVDQSGNLHTLIETQCRATKWIPTSEYAQYKLYYSSDNEIFEPCDKDWAAYIGTVDEVVQTEIDVIVRSAPAEYSPTEPMHFGHLMLRGGIPNSEATLLADSYVKPYFAYYPGYNSRVWLSDLAQHDFSTLDMLLAIQHMFNLRFFSDQSTKRVIVEPLDGFYTDTAWDCSDKIIESDDVVMIDMAHSASRTNKLGYQQKDGVVRRLGEADNKTFGEWSYSVESYAASPTTSSRINPVFSATANNEDGVLSVGDRDDTTSIDSLNFSPRIVRLFGLREIEGQQMPYAAFHSPDDDFTLCFENRDSITGLNAYYLNQQILEKNSQLITLSLGLEAIEYTSLLSPVEGSPSLRDIFSLDIKGETFRCHLYRVESYDTQSRIARCTFFTID